MKTAVIYARYSSDNQTEQSIEGQLRCCQDYAERNDISILNTSEEIDNSYSLRILSNATGSSINHLLTFCVLLPIVRYLFSSKYSFFFGWNTWISLSFESLSLLLDNSGNSILSEIYLTIFTWFFSPPGYLASKSSIDAPKK